MIRRVLVSAGVGVLALALAGCGMSSSSSSSAAAPTPAATGSSAAAVVSLANNSTLNHAILVDKGGMTLYYLKGETAGHLLCTSTQCLKFWPPLDLPGGATTPAAVKGIPMAKLGTVGRPGGKLQVTYDGWPLYTFAGDSSPGQAKGEDVKGDGGTWLAISSPAAAAAGATTSPSTSSGGSSSSGGGWS